MALLMLLESTSFLFVYMSALNNEYVCLLVLIYNKVDLLSLFLAVVLSLSTCRVDAPHISY